MHAVPMFRTYGKEDMCGAPANLESIPEGFIDPGYIYDAVSNTRTYYLLVFALRPSTPDMAFPRTRTQEHEKS